MAGKYRVLTTSAFDRQARKAVRGKRQLVDTLETLISILSRDPHNRSGRYRIKKLAGVDPGEGQWRIRSGDYRVRFDIVDDEVVLHSFRDRKDAYR